MVERLFGYLSRPKVQLRQIGFAAVTANGYATNATIRMGTACKFRQLKSIEAASTPFHKLHLYCLQKFITPQTLHGDKIL